MIRRIRNTALSCAFGASVAACATSSGPSIYSYVNVPPTPVNTRCMGGYQVFDKKDEGRLLITPYAVSLVANAACEGLSSSPRSPVTGVRYSAAAQEYLSMQNRDSVPLESRRTGCQLTGGTELALTHSEFTYQCSVPVKAVTPIPGEVSKSAPH